MIGADSCFKNDFIVLSYAIQRSEERVAMTSDGHIALLAWAGGAGNVPKAYSQGSRTHSFENHCRNAKSRNSQPSKGCSLSRSGIRPLGFRVNRFPIGRQSRALNFCGANSFEGSRKARLRDSGLAE